MNDSFVVMGNDFPDSVFSDEGEAEAYVKRKMDEQRAGLKEWESPRIYYRVYPFVVDAELEKPK